MAIEILMPSNKKHHYVPRFYLKFFSKDELSINIFNIGSGKTITDGNLKNQCYKDYFYGVDPTVEQQLGMIEGECSKVIKRMLQTQTMPHRETGEFVLMLVYLMTQHGRTAYSAEVLNESLDQMMKHLYGPQTGLSKKQLDSVRITHTEPGRASLGYSIQLYPLLLDLEWRLLTISNDLEFVTSDNPVVLYNQLMSFRRFGGNTGVANKGLQIFFPLSPKITLMLYDKDVYGVGTRNSKVIEINSSEDVDQLNRLQFVSALENVYYRDGKNNIAHAFERAKRFRRTQKSRMHVTVTEETESGRKELLATSREDVRTDLLLSFVRLLKKAKEWKREFQSTRIQPAVIIRSPDLVKGHEDFMKLVDAGKYSPGDFFKFVHDINLAQRKSARNIFGPY